MTKLYGAVVNNIRYVDEPDQVWAVEGVYKKYSDDGPLVRLRPYGRWRISLKLTVNYRKVAIGGIRDIMKGYLFRYRVDIDGNQTGQPDLIQVRNGKGIILNGMPPDAEPTWTWDLTRGPFVFNDSVEVEAPNEYCFVAYDAIFPELDPQYISGTISGLQPYGAIVGIGASNSDPLGLYNSSGVVFDGPPPAKPGDWDMPLEPLFKNGVVQAIVDGNSGHTIQDLDRQYGVGGWGAPRATWQADFIAQRLSLQSLFIWTLILGVRVAFTNKSLLEGQSVTYAWNFGDGTNDTSQNPTHSFPSAGTYIVTLTLVDSLGETSSFNQVVVIPLKAKFTVTVNGSFSNFVSITITQLSVGAVTYDWDFGDGTPHSSLEKPPHVYEKGHTYTIILKIGDGTGKFDTASQTINT